MTRRTWNNHNSTARPPSPHGSQPGNREPEGCSHLLLRSVQHTGRHHIPVAKLVLLQSNCRITPW